MIRKFSLLAIVAMTSVSGCAIYPKMFESEPVRVPTAKGDVICQLYTRNSVTWDHSIAHPQNMSVIEADNICFEMGYELAFDRKPTNSVIQAAQTLPSTDTNMNTGAMPMGQ